MFTFKSFDTILIDICALGGHSFSTMIETLHGKPPKSESTWDEGLFVGSFPGSDRPLGHVSNVTNVVAKQANP